MLNILYSEYVLTDITVDRYPLLDVSEDTLGDTIVGLFS